MSKYEELIISILKEADPYEELHIDENTDLIANEIIDSLMLVFLVTKLEEKIGVEIDASLVTPENFYCLKSIDTLLNKLITQ